MKKIISLIISALLIAGAAIPAFAEEAPAETVPADSAEMETEKTSSIFDLLEKSTVTYEVDMAAFYLEEMGEALAAGDSKAGYEAEEKRNGIIDKNGGAEKISYDDLSLLARLIYADAGSDWLSQDFRMCVGEVVLNRVASPEFPDSLYDVIYQKGQYSCTLRSDFTSLVPSQDCVDAAMRLLQGERLMAPTVVFQAGFVQGEVFSMYNDSKLGMTFFCVSNNLDLYPEE